MANQARASLKKLLSPQILCVSLRVNLPGLGGFVESIQLDPSGIVRIVSWCEGEFTGDFMPSVSLDGRAIPFLQCFRFKRQNVLRKQFGLPLNAGLALDYLVPEPLMGRSKILEVDFGEKGKKRYEGDFSFLEPDYRSLLDSSEVLHRDHIYGSGPLRDIARLATEKVIFTVPDASAIPMGFRHGVVPWPLLEGTHFNFLTQQSLTNALRLTSPRLNSGN